ncbi:hypothetical protein MYFR107205_20010 [Mycolicibacterium frederiksbergense]
MRDSLANRVGELDTDPTQALLRGQRVHRVRGPPHPRRPLRRTGCHTQTGQQIGARAQVVTCGDPGAFRGRNGLGDHMIEQIA